ncbi:MAG: hypothetical protein ACRCTP_04125 [Aeromonas popoffii]|uniref:hypothetical protein n=1 Tax=Aeromonas popoffii TaxID=70856 RepID=UPI003F3C5173
MDAIFFVNNQGKQVIPTPGLLNSALHLCNPENLVLPVSWVGFDLQSADLEVKAILVDCEDETDRVWDDRNVIMCRSSKLVRQALRAPTTVVNGVAYKVWQKGFGPLSSAPQKTIVVITDGPFDPLPEDPVFCELGIPAKDIFFVLESQLLG